MNANGFFVGPANIQSINDQIADESSSIIASPNAGVGHLLCSMNLADHGRLAAHAVPLAPIYPMKMAMIVIKSTTLFKVTIAGLHSVQFA